MEWTHRVDAYLSMLLPARRVAAGLLQISCGSEARVRLIGTLVGRHAAAPGAALLHRSPSCAPYLEQLVGIMRFPGLLRFFDAGSTRRVTHAGSLTRREHPPSRQGGGHPTLRPWFANAQAYMPNGACPALAAMLLQEAVLIETPAYRAEQAKRLCRERHAETATSDAVEAFPGRREATCAGWAELEPKEADLFVPR